MGKRGEEKEIPLWTNWKPPDHFRNIYNGFSPLTYFSGIMVTTADDGWAGKMTEGDEQSQRYKEKGGTERQTWRERGRQKEKTEN